MPFDLDISSPVASLMEDLPSRTRGLLFMRLAHLAEAAEVWPEGDLRWEQLAHRDGADLVLYVDGCCLRLQLQPEQRQLWVHEMGRVLVRLPAQYTLEEPDSLPGISC
jgi:hypothetical protein